MSDVRHGPGTTRAGEPYGQRPTGTGNGNGNRYDRLLERIHSVETIVAKIDARLDSTATKADLNELQSTMLKWFIVTLLAAIAAVAAVVSVFFQAGAPNG